MIACPQCGTAVQPDWDWCHACGWDPEGLMPPGVGPTPDPAPAATTARRTSATSAAPPGARPSAPGHPGHGPPPGYGVAPGPGGPPGYRPPAERGPSGATIARIAVVGVAALVAIVVVSVLAVVVLGRPSTTATVATTTATTNKPAPTEWDRWTVSDGSFSIEVPGPVETSPIDDELASDFAFTEGMTSQYGETLYGAMVFEIPPGFVFAEDPYPAMNSILDGIGEGAGITYSGRTRGNFGFLPSLSFTGSMVVGDGTTQGMAFMSERRVFIVYTAAFEGELVDYQHFVDSFVAGG